MKIEIDITEDQCKELKAEMITKMQMVHSGFSYPTIQDAVCMIVLKEVKKDLDLDQIAEKMNEG